MGKKRKTAQKRAVKVASDFDPTDQQKSKLRQQIRIFQILLHVLSLLRL